MAPGLQKAAAERFDEILKPKLMEEGIENYVSFLLAFLVNGQIWMWLEVDFSFKNWRA